MDNNCEHSWQNILQIHQQQSPPKEFSSLHTLQWMDQVFFGEQ